MPRPIAPALKYIARWLVLACFLPAGGAWGALEDWAARGWVTDFEAGMMEAARSERPAFVYFHAPWCSWCQVYERDTLRHPRVEAALKARFVPVVVDFDARSDLVRRYGAKGLPYTVLLGPDGKVWNAFVGILRPDDLLAVLDELLARGGPVEAPAVDGRVAAAAGAGLEAYRRFRRAWLDHVASLYDAELGTLAGSYATGAGLKRPSPLTWIYLERHRLWTARAARAARVERARLQDAADGGFFNFLDPHREDEYAETSKLLEANAWMIAWQAHRAWEGAARRSARAGIGFLRRRLWNPAGGGFWQALVAVPGYGTLSVAERRRRPPPVLRIQRADTNAQAAWALAEAAVLLRDRDTLALARRGLAFVLSGLWHEGRLYHFRQGGDYVLPDPVEDRLWVLAAAGALRAAGVAPPGPGRLARLAARARDWYSAAARNGTGLDVPLVSLAAWVAADPAWGVPRRHLEGMLARLRIEADTPPDDVVLGLLAWERYLWREGIFPGKDRYRKQGRERLQPR